MIDVSQNFFAINNDVTVESVSYELYSNNGFKKIITSYRIASIQNLNLFLNLKVSFGFSLIAQDDLIFEDKNTYYVSDVYDPVTSTFNVEIALEDESVTDLFAYIRIFDEEDSINIYDKLYRENLIDTNVLLVENFVDYTLEDDSSYINDYKDPRQLQEEYIEKNYNKIQNYSYTTNLFHFFRRGNQVNCFFGVDVESYVKDKNPLTFLNEDQDFNNYIRENNSVEEVQGYVYVDKQHTFIDSIELEVGLQNILGRVYGFVFEVPKDFDRSNLYGYEAQIAFKDILIEYLNDNLLPILRTENQFLRELDIQDTFTTIETRQISKTITTFASYLDTIVDNASQIMALFQSSPTLALNDKLRNILLDVNQKIYNILLDGLSAKQISSSTNETLTKDFGYVINASRIDYGVEVLNQAQDTSLINSYTLDELTERSTQELQKYFGDQPTSVEVSGEQVSIVNQSTSVLSSISLFVNDREELNNQKSPNNEFSYDETLNYLNSINKIINKNIDKDPIIYPSKTIVALSDQEVATEDRTIQNNGALNALTINQSENLRSARLTNNLLAIKDNIIKTFEIPSTLRTDLCADEPSITQPSEGATVRKDVDAQSFFGNSLISYGVLNKIKSLKENDFYEPYLRITSSTKEELEKAPIQAAYLFNYYSQDREEPSFLQKQNLLGEITNFGVNYHNFKSLFSVKIYINEERQFVSLDRSIIDSLGSGTNYLCVIDHYRNINYGMETPELLRTSIYNKYFILTT
tara:strand:- start:8363 stop:10618 length:2256 start_codon:yes stop_codon:yes gene_type:complete